MELYCGIGQRQLDLDVALPQAFCYRRGAVASRELLPKRAVELWKAGSATFPQPPHPRRRQISGNPITLKHGSPAQRPGNIPGGNVGNIS